MYVCGTIHLLREEDYPLPQPYDTAYSDAQRIVMELPPGGEKGEALATLMANAGRAEKGSTLFDHINQPTQDALRGWANRRGLGTQAMTSFQPWYAALVVAATEYEAAGAEAGRGVDTHYEARAAKDGKPGEGLETVQEQIDLFAKLSAAQQAELLEQTLAEVSKIKEMFAELVDAWRKGDIEHLNEMLYEEAEKYPDLLDHFLYQRNLRWMKRLEALLAGEEKVMVLVGSGHLGGPKGVLELLRAKGYRLTQLTAEKAHD
jgi:uncharacterized protein YbaP (TraB family)